MKFLDSSGVLHLRRNYCSPTKVKRYRGMTPSLVFIVNMPGLDLISG